MSILSILENPEFTFFCGLSCGVILTIIGGLVLVRTQAKLDEMPDEFNRRVDRAIVREIYAWNREKRNRRCGDADQGDEQPLIIIGQGDYARRIMPADICGNEKTTGTILDVEA